MAIASQCCWDVARGLLQAVLILLGVSGHGATRLFINQGLFFTAVGTALGKCLGHHGSNKCSQAGHLQIEERDL